MWYSGKQQSLIPDSAWKRINGVYRSAFYRNNLKTDGTAAGNIALYQGDRLAGKTITIRFTNSETTNKNKIKYVELGYTKT